MEHGSALSAGACVLDVDASERVTCHLCLQVNFVGKDWFGWSWSPGLDMSLEQSVGIGKTDGAARARTGSTNSL